MDKVHKPTRLTYGPHGFWITSFNPFKLWLVWVWPLTLWVIQWWMWVKLGIWVKVHKPTCLTCSQHRFVTTFFNPFEFCLMWVWPLLLSICKKFKMQWKCLVVTGEGTRFLCYYSSTDSRSRIMVIIWSRLKGSNSFCIF